jgi:tetratricopeptide (TPR) repeat protein
MFKTAVQKVEEARLRQVPIGRIIEAECRAIGFPERRQKEIRKDYERYVSGLMNAVSVWLGFGEAGTADRQKLASAVRNVDNERELLEYLSSVFHNDFEASYEKEKLLIISIKDNKFNCYSSTGLLTDVLLRLGKPVTIIATPQHVLLSGERWALETTAEVGTATFSRDMLEQVYPVRHEGGIDLLCSLTYEWCGSKLNDRGMPDSALLAYENEIKLNPNDAHAWYNKGNTLHDMRELEGALSAYNKSIELDPNNASSWFNKGNTLYDLKEFEDALVSYGRSIKLNPNDAHAWYNKGATLQMMEKLEGALSAYNKSTGLDPSDIYAWLNKGYVLSRLNKKEESEACFKKAREVETAQLALERSDR